MYICYVHLEILIKKKYGVFSAESGMDTSLSEFFCTSQTPNQGGAEKIQWVLDIKDNLALLKYLVRRWIL